MSAVSYIFGESAVDAAREKADKVGETPQE
jgi:hypothetical protein